ncbi:MAG: leucine-rich repeat domain-containing protein [bacterium]
MKNIAIICLLAGLAAGCRTHPTPSAARPQDYLFWTNNGTVTISGYVGTGGDVTVPHTLGGLPVTRIGNLASDNWGDLVPCVNSNLTSVIIPSSVTNISDCAFLLCLSLTNVTISRGVTSIGDGAFCHCPSLAAVQFQGNAPILGGTSVFLGCTKTVYVYYLKGTTGWGETFGGRPTRQYSPKE